MESHYDLGHGIYLSTGSEISITRDGDIWKATPELFKTLLLEARSLCRYVEDLEHIEYAKCNGFKRFMRCSDRREKTKLLIALKRVTENRFASVDDKEYSKQHLQEIKDYLDRDFEPRRPSPDLRERILARDLGRCRYCHSMSEEIHIDHVKPHSRGGKTIFENLVVSCSVCNRKKHDRTPEQAGMKLLDIPSNGIETAQVQE